MGVLTPVILYEMFSYFISIYLLYFIILTLIRIFRFISFYVSSYKFTLIKILYNSISNVNILRLAESNYVQYKTVFELWCISINGYWWVITRIIRSAFMQNNTWSKNVNRMPTSLSNQIGFIRFMLHLVFSQP